jgi:hypothetical protein
VFIAFLPRYIGLQLLVMLAAAGFVATGSPPDTAHLMAPCVKCVGIIGRGSGRALQRVRRAGIARNDAQVFGTCRSGAIVVLGCSAVLWARGDKRRHSRLA